MNNSNPFPQRANDTTKKHCGSVLDRLILGSHAITVRGISYDRGADMAYLAHPARNCKNIYLGHYLLLFIAKINEPPIQLASHHWVCPK
jgi:hypothetical protein